MLIYNAKKEFIGIDESDLKILGFSTLAQLQEEVADFADLFVKEPGHVHNFKHVHWIDFVECAEPTDVSKVLIKIKSQVFTANLSIETLYLRHSAESKSHLIYLNSLRATEEGSKLTLEEDIYNEVMAAPSIIKETPKLNILLEPDEEELQEEAIENSILKPDIVFETPSIKVATVEEKIEEKTVAVEEEYEEYEEIIEEDFEESSYVYNPQVASDELGLPIDLIEEFIEDFIAQAKEFKVPLYAATKEANIEEIASLSHKLKGVAANLRVEDAFEILATINDEKDIAQIHKDLDSFYRMVAKLAGEEPQKQVKVIKRRKPISKKSVPPVVKKEEIPQETTNFAQDIDLEYDDEELTLSFKNEEELIPFESASFAQDIALDDDELTLSFKDEEEKTPQETVNFAQDIVLEEEKEILPQKTETFAQDIVVDEEEDIVDFSKKTAANEIGLDTETFDELFDDYIIDAHAISSTIHEAIHQNDFELCKKEISKFKSMSECMHIQSFDSPIESLMLASDNETMTQAMKRIDRVIAKISE